jgi:hypothetical protein
MSLPKLTWMVEIILMMLIETVVGGQKDCFITKMEKCQKKQS